MHSARITAASAIVFVAFVTLTSSARSAAPFPADTMLLDFQADWCGPCRQMESTVAQLIAAGYPIRKVNIDREPELRQQYGITGIPCFVLVSGGREVARTEGRVSAGELQAMFAKAATAAIAAAPRATASVAPAPTTDPFMSAGANRRNELSASNQITSASPASARGWSGMSGPAPNGSLSPGALSTGPPSTGPVSTSQFLAASVRISVDDPTGVSSGSGTLVDSRSGEALVLTCAHIFRVSQGKGTVLVDIFGARPQAKVPGQVVSYDLKRDVALVSIRPTGIVATIPVAPPGYVTKVGDRVASVGCDKGADPTVRESRVSALNKFLGPANVEVSGQPVEGRSGGGLFSADGYVIGVCNAADPADNEGLYAALATIHAQLDQANLTAIYRRPTSGPSASPASLARSNDPPGGAAGPRPNMPTKMPTSPLVGLAGATSGASASGSGAVGWLTSQERATLAELQQKSQHAEVICIVRSLNDPQAKSEIIVLDRASPAFLHQLSAERSTQDGRHLTSSFEPAPAPSFPASAPAANGKMSLAGNSGQANPAATRLWQPNWRVSK